MRKLLAFLASCGIAASIFAYICSFSGVRVNSIFLWEAPLVLGTIALYVPIYAVEYSARESASPWRGITWKQMARGMPSWVTPCAVLLLLIYVGHFVWFTVHTGLGVPSIRDGQYVISHGRNLRVLSQPEYFTLKAAELRMLATLMVNIYFVPMMYWWYRRNQPQTS
ncbi:MAG TPA: hypothetical protein VGM02_15875 [Acidobacteriaceae bacterium]